MKLDNRIQQSAVRVRSGIRLVLFLLAVPLLSVLLNIHWLRKVSLGLVVFFAAVTGLEYWNVWRLRRQRQRSGS
jgi:lipopolysaccharide export LptBFGC system permease protein LptF